MRRLCKPWVLIDCSLSWKSHIEHIMVKISRLVGIIAKLKHFVPRNTLLCIYQSLILPYISYGLTAWGLASKSYLAKIIVLQKRALRFIFSVERCEHAVPLFIDANILIQIPMGIPAAALLVSVFTFTKINGR